MTPEIITPETESTQFQCRHIFTDGRRCGSPAIRGPEGAESFCYFHHNSRRPIQDAPTRKRRQSRFALPNPEDRSAIQQSIGEVLRRIASNEIDPRRAGLLLYGLQIASLNLPPRTNKPNPREELSEFVTEVTHDPEHGLLAPPAEFVEPGSNKPCSTLELLLDELGSDEPGPDETRPEDPSPQPPAESLIDLHASTEDPSPQQERRTHRCSSRRVDTTIPSAHERISTMSNFIPKPPSPKLTGLGPKAQKLAALREKAAAAQADTTAPAAAGSNSAAKPRNSFAGKKTAFQRKAT